MFDGDMFHVITLKSSRWSAMVVHLIRTSLIGFDRCKFDRCKHDRAMSVI